MRLMLQLCGMVLLLLGVGNCAWGRVAVTPRTAVWGFARSEVFCNGGDEPPALLTSGGAAAWGFDIASAGCGLPDSTPTMASPIAVTFRGAAFWMCSGAPPAFKATGITTNLSWAAYGPNLYTYVKQNPWTGFDPLGLDMTTAQKAAATVTAAECEAAVAALGTESAASAFGMMMLKASFLGGGASFQFGRAC